MQKARLQSGSGSVRKPDQAQWFLCLAILIICLILAMFSDEARRALRYQPDVFVTGEIWRLLSAHFVHLGWSHLILNMIGLLVLWSIYGGVFATGFWVLIILLSSAGITSGFLLLDPSLDWYVGLSGVLHAILAASLTLLLLRAIFLQPHSYAWEDGVLSLLLIAKLTYEQMLGALPLTESASGSAVIVNAHLYGAIGGCICTLFLFKFIKLK